MGRLLHDRFVTIFNANLQPSLLYDKCRLSAISPIVGMIIQSVDATGVYMTSTEAQFSEDDFVRLTGEAVKRFSIFYRHGNTTCLKGWTDTNDPLFIKYFRGGDGGMNAAAEYQALTKYYDGMKDSQTCKCQKPLGLFQDDTIGGAILSEWTTARRGDRYFKLFMPFGFLRRRGIVGAADWLSTFHNVSGLSQSPLIQCVDLDRLMEDLSLVSAAQYFAGEKAKLQKKVAEFGAQLHDAKSEPVLCSKMHGDFTPANLFITRKEVIGFDFTAKSTGPVLLDIGKFLTTLIWYGYFDLRKAPGEKFLDDVTLFMSAYSKRVAIDPPEIRRIFLVKALVDLARRLETEAKAGGAKKATKKKHRARVLGVLGHVLGERRR